MSVLFIEYPKCTTCKKAKSWLDENGIQYIDRHIKEQNPTYDELKQWIEQSGLDIKKFFNTSGILYKDMHLKDKLPQMSYNDKIKLLSTDGMLVKRPLIITDEHIFVGFKPEQWQALIK